MRITIFFLILLATAACNSNNPKSTGNTAQEQSPSTEHSTAMVSTSQTNDSITHQAFANTGIYITDGFFRIYDEITDDEIKKQFEETMRFVAITTNDEEGIIKPVGVKVEFGENECTGDHEAVIYTDNAADFVCLISGLSQYNEKPIENLTKENDKELLPNKPFNFTFSHQSYTLYATADVEDDVYEAKNYRLYFQKDSTTQHLTTINQLEYNMPSILFVGDIDGDEYPDLLLQEGYNYEYHKIVLYLSSYAEEGELVKIVAIDEEWRDC